MSQIVSFNLLAEIEVASVLSRYLCEPHAVGTHVMSRDMGNIGGRQILGRVTSFSAWLQLDFNYITRRDFGCSQNIQ